jgi:FAD:protein FMN transferase
MSKSMILVPQINRRRFIKICAAASAGLILQPSFVGAEPVLHRWTGIALGAKAEINLLHQDPDKARDLFRLVEAEISRLEAIFSLYREDSELVRLNREGKLFAPSLELVELLGLSKQVHAQTLGAFDPTIQPLWDYYARSAAGVHAETAQEFTAALERVNFENVAINPAEIQYLKPGMAMTLNGIAQGFITDRVAALLSAQGCSDVVVDLGEISAKGAAQVADGLNKEGWPITLRPDAQRPKAQAKVTLANAAVASSAKQGTTFDQNGRNSHILDPRTGLPVENELIAASVIARTAALADGLSTAALVLGENKLLQSLEKAPGTRAFIVRNDNTTDWLSA